MSAITKDSERSDILFVSFNQDYTCFAVGTETGFIIYDCDPLQERFRRDPFLPSPGGIGIVEMLFRCNILALVGGGTNPKFSTAKVIIWDDYQNKCLAELEFRMPVNAVRLRKDKILVVVETKIYVYNFADVSLLRAIDTCSNPRGLVSLSSESPILVCPSEKRGELYVNTGLSDTKLWPKKGKEDKVQVHDGSLACVAINSDGSLIATASDKGTLIRVWSTKNCEKVDEFRRGSDRADIYSIAFSHDSSLLVVSSDKGTVHLFSLTDKIKNSEATFKTVGSFFTSYADSKWSAASFRIPEVGAICCFGQDPNSVIVVTTDGCHFKYTFTVDNKTATVQNSPEYAMFLKKNSNSTTK